MVLHEWAISSVVCQVPCHTEVTQLMTPPPGISFGVSSLGSGDVKG